MNVWSGEKVILVAGDSAEDAALEAERVAALYPAFPWLRPESNVWRRLGEAEVLTICDPSEPVTRTAGEWARLRGRGLLAVPDFTTGQAGPWRGPEWLRTYEAPLRN